MTETATKLPVKTEGKSAAAPASFLSWRPFETLRHEIDRLFEDFAGAGRTPLWQRELTWAARPAVDVTETEKAYEITAELPGLDEKNVEVSLVSGGLTIKGEKQDEKEEKKKDYYLHERHFGSFERYFKVPDDVDAEKIEASFKKGVLTVTLPKKPEAQKPAKKIAIKAA